jgi:hypothetical protein
VLSYPWDELLLLIAEGQEIEADDGFGDQTQLLASILNQLQA